MPARTLRDLANIRKWLDEGAENQIENRENVKGDIFDNERSANRSNGKTRFAVETPLSVIISRNGRGQPSETEANCFMTLDSQQLSARPSTNAVHGDSCPFWKLKLRKCLDLGSDGVFLDFREAALLLGSHVCCVGQAWWHFTTEMKSIKAFDFLFGSEILAIKDVFISSH